MSNEKMSTEQIKRQLEICLSVSRSFRSSVANEDSILLQQSLLELDRLLGTGLGEREEFKNPLNESS